MRYFKLNIDDFKRVFTFGTDYYIDPTKNTTGRTTGEPRGLGAILDSFTLGKLTEIGIEKILTEININKKYILDFDIKGNHAVKDEPDITGIVENNNFREPQVFVEIKNTSENDRWIGLTEEQFNTIKRASKGSQIYMIYASLKSNTLDNNPKTADLTGMFLKEIENREKSTIFQKFADLNAECRIEFILTSQDLENFSFPFEKGMNMYETNLFEEKKRSSFYSAHGLRKDIVKIEEFENLDEEVSIEIEKGVKAEKEEISTFHSKGSFKLLYKKKKTYIECLSNVELSNEIFGTIYLKQGCFYSFNLETVGRDPKLKRNNIFIAKKRVYQLIDEGKIRKPEEVISEIVREI